MNDRITNHPNYSASDYRYFQAKGYDDEEILAFWDRDAAQGQAALIHRPNPRDERDLGEVIRDSLSPEAVAMIAAKCGRKLGAGPVARSAERESDWFAEMLIDMLGTSEYERLFRELGL